MGSNKALQKDPIGRESRDLLGGFSRATIQPSFCFRFFSLPFFFLRREANGGVAREEIFRV